MAIFEKLNSEQVILLDSVNGNLDEARKCLDAAMFYSGKVTDNDMKKMREIYDTICKAQDLL